MSDSTRIRLIGTGLFLFSAFAFWIEIGGGLGILVNLAAAALLGFSTGIVLTGKRLWNSDTWWASKSPLERI